MSRDFHPDLRVAAKRLPRGTVGPLTLRPLRFVIKILARSAAVAGVDVVTLDGGVGVRIHRPRGGIGNAPAPALLWIHGGGLVMGAAELDDALCRRFADTLGITVASVNYRLAPEHPYPAALDDCYTALSWLASQPGVDTRRVAIGGASAGGGLAAALALHARDRAEIPVASQLLVYPMLDDRSTTRKSLDHKKFRLWSQRNNQYGWSSYLAGADPEVAVPARRADLSGLAPAWIGVGTLDLFYDEDLDYARRLRAAGVPCEVMEVPGAFHGFDLAVSKADVSRAFFSAQCEFLRQALVH